MTLGGGVTWYISEFMNMVYYFTTEIELAKITTCKAILHSVKHLTDSYVISTANNILRPLMGQRDWREEIFRVLQMSFTPCEGHMHDGIHKERLRYP